LNDTNPVQRLILTHHETHFTHSVVHEYEKGLNKTHKWGIV